MKKKKKKITIIGRGTAGSITAAMMYKRHGFETEWIYDSNIKTQPVGEGSILGFPMILYKHLGFTSQDIASLDGTYKIGLKKEGWGKTGKQFYHHFGPGNFGYHFNAVALQDYVSEKVSDSINIIDKNIKSYDDIDADYIMDCSGRPLIDDSFIKTPYIPINAAYVTQCYWDHPRFNHTLAIARPYGWVFGVPLKNRCSIGYMFNENFNTFDEVKEDVKHIFDEYNLTPSNNTNSIRFPNYYKKQNYTDRICFNGNSSFFLEPLEATSIAMMTEITYHGIWFAKGDISLDDANRFYGTKMKEIENVIMLHYFAGSIYDTKFWTYAKEMGYKNMVDSTHWFKHMVEYCTNPEFGFGGTIGVINAERPPKPNGPMTYKQLEGYGTWTPGSFNMNLNELGIMEELKNMYGIKS